MNKTDWTKWSAIAEVLSAIAIIVTLIYLAVQTQQNAEAIRAASAQDALERETVMLSVWLDQPDIALHATGDSNSDLPLSAEDMVRLHAFSRSMSEAKKTSGVNTRWVLSKSTRLTLINRRWRQS